MGSRSGYGCAMDMCHPRQEVKPVMATHQMALLDISTQLARTSDLASRIEGWSRLGMLKYNEMYKKVKEDRVAENGAFDSE
jgi:hypothetical protein